MDPAILQGLEAHGIIYTQLTFFVLLDPEGPFGLEGFLKSKPLGLGGLNGFSMPTAKDSKE